MRFYLGTHMIGPRWWDARVPLFVSRRRLIRQETMPRARVGWALDSGGFTELDLHGRWETTEDEYVADVLRFQEEIGLLEWAAPMDWMCEPQMLQRTGLQISDHVRLTVENFVRLRDRLGSLVIPVLQGWELDDYLACAWEYAAADVDLGAEPIVGLGTVCRRQDTDEAGRIVRRLAGIFGPAGGLRLHGFGVKTTGLRAFGDQLVSADSMAWSYAARKRRVADEPAADRLFDQPRVGLCGATLRTEAHPAKSCANCLPWALQWRLQEVPV